MNKVPCLYSVIRFLPYRETEEFANVGILLFSEKLGYLAHRLETSKHARFTDFFVGLDAKVFTEGVKSLDKELKSILPDCSEGTIALPGTGSDLKQAFDYLVRPRRTLLYFSEPRVLLADSPKESLDTLFHHYVEKRFAQAQEPEEVILRHNVSTVLTEINVRNSYRHEKVGNESYDMDMPFLHRGQKGTKAIKPISFDLAESNRIWAKGDRLLRGFDRLASWSLLPSRLLIPVRHPDAPKKGDASRALCAELKQKAGVEVIDADDHSRLKVFAQIDDA